MFEYWIVEEWELAIACAGCGGSSRKYSKDIPSSNSSISK
jgi:hypothetical protein